MPTLDRPYRAFCLLRDPAERVWSLYHGLKLLGRSKSGPNPAIATGREILRRDWSVADIYRELGNGGPGSSELHGRFRAFFDDQTRRILAPWRDTSTLAFGSGAAAARAFRDEALEILDRRYVVGTKEHYRSSLDRFADAFGWQHLSGERVDRSAPRDRIDPATRALILAYNSHDVELHAHFTRELTEGTAASRMG